MGLDGQLITLRWLCLCCRCHTACCSGCHLSLWCLTCRSGSSGSSGSGSAALVALVCALDDSAGIIINVSFVL